MSNLSGRIVVVRNRLTIRDVKSTLRFYDYHDPVPGYERYTWTGAAPLGHTGYVVVTQQLPRVARLEARTWTRAFASHDGYLWVLALALAALVASLVPLRIRRG